MNRSFFRTIDWQFWISVPILILLPFLTPYQAIATNILIVGLFATGFNLLLGYTGAYYTYIVTDRILKEDGYEASGIIQYTNLSGPLQAGVDRRIEQFFVEIRQKMGIFFSQ